MDLNQALKFLMEKYSVNKEVVINADNTVTVDGKTMALMSHRAERRFIEFKNLVINDSVKGISTMRVCHIDSADKDLFDILYREVDICEWVLCDEIAEIFAIKNDKALNVIAKTKKGYVCTFELANTLKPGASIIDKHEVIAEKGVICDRAVDTQVPQSSIYVFGSDGECNTYTDVDAELFGLDADSCAKVRQAFEIAKSGSDLIADGDRVKAVVDAAKKSADTLENIIL